MVYNLIYFFYILKTVDPMGNYQIKLNTKNCPFFTTLRRPKIQTLLTFHIDKMIINNISVSFVSTQLLKHSRNRSKLYTFEYRAYDKPYLIKRIDSLN